MVEFEEREYVLRQHEQGSEFFMVDSGECVVEVHGGVVHRYVDGGSSGERALLNNEPRTASIRVTFKALVCFRMKQEVPQKIMTERIKLLRQVKLMRSFGRQELTEAEEALELVLFSKGDRVVTRGKNVIHFYIVDGGVCGGEANNNAFTYTARDSFGERVPLRDEPHVVDIVVVFDALKFGVGAHHRPRK